jgi:hypothetical protein
MGANLITKAEYKTYAGITSVNQDAEIDLLIPKVSELVKTYCRRTFVDFYDEAKIEMFEGGYGSLILKETPVTQVISVQQSTDYGQTYTKLTKFSDWVQSGDFVVSVNPRGFEPLINGYKVSYFAGYETVPEDLKLAVLDLVTYYRKNDGAIHSTKAPGTNAVQIEYISTTSLPAHIKRVLDQYVADYT